MTRITTSETGRREACPWYEVLKAAIREAGRGRAVEELEIKEYPREVVHGLDAKSAGYPDSR